MRASSVPRPRKLYLILIFVFTGRNHAATNDRNLASGLAGKRPCRLPSRSLWHPIPLSKSAARRYSGVRRKTPISCAVRWRFAGQTVAHLPLGNGSNTLFADEGYDGAVIDLRGLNFGPYSGTTSLTAPPALPRAPASRWGGFAPLPSSRALQALPCLRHPRHYRRAVYMNAGAYGGEMKDVLENVTFFGQRRLTERTLPAAELALGCTTSLFEQHPIGVCFPATVRLQPGDSAAILAEMQDYLQRRKDKQPMEWPSAGSTFKRPLGAFAGKLIEDCGLRGLYRGRCPDQREALRLCHQPRRRDLRRCRQPDRSGQGHRAAKTGIRWSGKFA